MAFVRFSEYRIRVQICINGIRSERFVFGNCRECLKGREREEHHHHGKCENKDLLEYIADRIRLFAARVITLENRLESKQSAVSLRRTFGKGGQNAVRFASFFNSIVSCRSKVGFLYFAILHKLAVHDFDMAVGVLFDKRYLVRYDNHKLGFGYFLQNIHDLHCIFRVKVACRLIGKNYIAAFYDCAGDCDSLLLSARKRVAEFVFEPLHIDELQRLFGAAGDFFFVLEPCDHHLIAQDFRYRIAFFKIVVLENEADFCVSDLIGFTARTFAVDINLTAIGFFKSADNIEKGCFTASRFAENTHKTFIGKFKRNTF